MGTVRWNVFARELEDILARKGFRLGHLDDRAGIHREKVRRLQHSLGQPRSFPVLTAEELEEVIEAFGINEREQYRLYAAVIAAAVEERLMDRIDSENALIATEEIFPLLFKALWVNRGGKSGLAVVRGEEEGEEK
jgi:hypothetical protein